MVPKQPGHAVINVLADQQQLARRTLEAAMNPFTNALTSSLSNPLLNPFAGLFGLWAQGLAQGQAAGEAGTGAGGGVKSFATIYADGGTPRVRITLGDYDIDEILMAAQSLLEQIRDPQYNSIRDSISQLLDWEVKGIGGAAGVGERAGAGGRNAGERAGSQMRQEQERNAGRGEPQQR